jgi:pantoate--beta-alanine ligase
MRKALTGSMSVGFVPTMGALHEGHLSLARAARAENDVVVASIFVNPTQFLKGEDLDKYPRQMEKDVELLREVGVDHVFTPSVDSMYGKNHVTFVDPVGFDATREGSIRPGHFRGVATIVTKLFNIVHPTNAYFGQKDAAQCVLIRRITDDLDMDVNVKVMATVREEDGLAMSSRNAYLTVDERASAVTLYKALCAAREVFESRLARGLEELEATDVREVVEEVLKTEPLIKEIQYVAIDDLEQMKPLERVGSGGCIVSLACVVGSVRLIDNIILK